MSDSDSENGDGAFAPNQALPVANLPFNFDGVPQDGLEYLFTVRRDSKRLPRYTRAPNPYISTDVPEPLPALQNAHKSFPSEEWKASFIQRFRNYRENLHSAMTQASKHWNANKKDREPLPNLQQKAWWDYISGTFNVAPNEANVEPQESTIEDGMLQGGHEPSLWILHQIPTRQIVQVLYWHSVWADTHAEVLAADEITTTTPIRRLTPVHQRWMFSLLGRLDANLVGDDISTLRTLARALIRLIVAQLQSDPSLHSQTQMEALPVNMDGSSEQERSNGSELSGYWMVIAAIVGIWGQSDIWDEAKQNMSTIVVL